MEETPTQDESPARRALGDAKAVIAFLTRLPLQAPHYDLARACWAFPVAGLMVGIIAGTVFAVGLAFDIPSLAAALLAIMASVLVTGALHEDGLADLADGLGGHDPDQRLEIMRDSRVGAFGVMALIFSIGLRATAVTVFVDPIAGFTALVASAVLSRGMLPALMYNLPLASESGLAASAGKPARQPVFVSLALTCVAAIALLGPGLASGALLISALAVLGVALLAKRLIGGYNGDSLGAAQQSVEIAVLLLIATAT